jgi:hypothetical protein
MTKQSVRIGTYEVVVTPSESEDGSFVASVARGKQSDQAFPVDDWTDARVRLNASRTICEAFGINRNNQNLTKIANAIEAAMS